jgi:hypothetical protein
MKNKPPVPVCTVFLTCRKLAIDSATKEDILIGLPRAFWTRSFPNATPLSFLIRCTSAHGGYAVEVHLQNSVGEVVWKDGPPEPWVMMDPLEMYDLKINTCVIFPAPGIYQFVLVLSGEEVARQRFHAIEGEVPERKPQDEL